MIGTEKDKKIRINFRIERMNNKYKTNVSKIIFLKTKLKIIQCWLENRLKLAKTRLVWNAIVSQKKKKKQEKNLQVEFP